MGVRKRRLVHITLFLQVAFCKYSCMFFHNQMSENFLITHKGFVNNTAGTRPHDSLNSEISIAVMTICSNMDDRGDNKVTFESVKYTCSTIERPLHFEELELEESNRRLK